MKQVQTGNQRLIQKIVQHIKQSEQQAITFADYMSLCLYEPDDGYYTSERVKIGKEGDFYTSSFIGTIMGEMLATTCMKLAPSLFADDEVIHLVEWGGGHGRLAQHLLDECQAQWPEYYDRIKFTSIEESPLHRQFQQEALRAHTGHTEWLTAVEWLAQQPLTAIVLSNELLDAFPVHRLSYEESNWHEIMVSWDEGKQCFAELAVPLQDERLWQYISDEQIEPNEGQRIEVNLLAQQWIQQVGRQLHDGVLISIDYGATSEELYADHRMDGTLLCYRRHQAHGDPYRYVGEQDITSHVNFSACIRAGQQVGFNQWRYIDQKTFLVEAGILEKLKDHTSRDPFHPQAKINRSIRQILWSDQMSELFKVLIQSKSNSLRIHSEEGPECNA